MLLALAMVVSTAAEPAEPFATPTPVAITATVSQDTRMALPSDAGAYLERARTIVGARVEAQPSASARLVGDARFVWLGETQAGDVASLADRAKVDPFRLEADALFAEWHGGRGWLRFGRQTVRWGSGLLVNPTSTVGPIDLEDPLRYAQPMGTEMMRGNLALGRGVHVEALWVPLFRPPLLAPIDARTAMLRSGDAQAVALASDPSWTIDVTSSAPAPPSLASNSQAAARVSGSLLGVDLAASAYRGRAELPQLGSATLTADLATKTLSGDATLVYPRVSVLGLDAATTLPLDVGAFAEVAWNEATPFTRTVTVNGFTQTSRELAKPWTRAAAGLDRTFSTNTYVAAEYLRGFVDELGLDQQHDYVLAIADQALLRDRLHVHGVAILATKDDSLLLSPSLDWNAADALTLSLGGWLSTGGRAQILGSNRIGPPIVIGKASISF